MSFARARGRYLAAMGLMAAPMFSVACKEAAQPVAVGMDDASTASGDTIPAASTAASPDIDADVAAAVASVAPTDFSPTPPPSATFHMPSCPNGKFCVAEPAKLSGKDAGAPSPYTRCAATTRHPSDPPDGGVMYRAVSFDKEGTAAERANDPKACCYTWVTPCPGGRALMTETRDEAIVAGAVKRADWCAAIDALDLVGLSADTRAALAAHWTREAAFEHASVASFARATLDLMAVGAPPELLAEVQAAAIDEIEHARIAFALARAYGGADVGPGALPAAAFVSGARTLAEVARDTFIDACAGESIAALAVREAACGATDPTVRALLARIADDEDRHAALAWKTIAWALRVGDDDVHRALSEAAQAFRRERDTLRAVGASTSENLLAREHGVLDERDQRDLRARAIADVVLPCVDALLGSRANVRTDYVADA